MGIISKLARTALFQLDAEKAHSLAISGLKAGHTSGLLPGPDNNRFTALNVNVAGLDFPNPVGMAAGFDKNCEVPGALLKLGFGFTEAGTVTPHAQQGNPRPRVFRLTRDRAIINRLGFNNKGHDYVAQKLQALIAFGSEGGVGILGINIGANKDSEDFIGDYELGLAKFCNLASYFTANISSPNTPGLRNLQSANALSELLARLDDKRQELASTGNKNPPLFLKIAPDLDEAQLDEISEIAMASKIDGLVISNTTIERRMLSSTNNEPGGEPGGLSGRPLFKPSTIVLAKMRQRVGKKLAIIGVGGIDDVQSAWEKIEAGADLLQLYTGMIYRGPTIASIICRGLVDRLKNSDHATIASLTGSKTKHWAAQNLQKAFLGQ